MGDVESVRPVAEKVDLGEEATSSEPQGACQDYNQLRKECLTENRLFEDPEFPAEDSSLYFSKKPTHSVEWKRPTEIVGNPKLFVDGFSRFDLNQGDLQDCWFVAACANLAMHPNLFFKVVPEDQSFEVNYAGIFHFRFWQYGRWADVVIDDRLPTSKGKLMNLGSPENTEFWGALLEKAYAKLHGSYEALIDGTPYEAMEDFTGGITETYNMNAVPVNLFNVLLEAQERNSLIGCMMEQGLNKTETVTPQGLIRWHSYSITQIKCVDKKAPNQAEKILLMRLRNPWGTNVEWNGEWSDESPKWRHICSSEREELGLKLDMDGEFWMSFQDFKRYFHVLQICNLSPDSLTNRAAGNKKWELSAVEGKWVPGKSAGGCRNFEETFWQNPQYRITLEHPDEGEDKCSVIVALLQKNRRALKSKGAVKLHIGFAVYHLTNPNKLQKTLDKMYFAKNRNNYVAQTALFFNDREVSERLKLTPGVYCIVPSTFEPQQEGEFLLRVFSDTKNTNMKEKNEQICTGETEERSGDDSGDCSLL